MFWLTYQWQQDIYKMLKLSVPFKGSQFIMAIANNVLCFSAPALHLFGIVRNFVLHFILHIFRTVE